MFLLTTISLVVVLFLYLIFNKKSVKPSEIQPYKTKLQILQEYAESFLIDCNIPLENVLVHNYNEDGACIKAATRHNLCRDNEMYYLKYSNILDKNNEYLYLPEIKNYRTTHVWLHEIAHYIFKHKKDTPVFVNEFEAEIYAINMFSKIQLNYNTNPEIAEIEKELHELELQNLRDEAIHYIESYIAKANVFDIEKYLSNEILFFICENPEFKEKYKYLLN